MCDVSEIGPDLAGLLDRSGPDMVKAGQFGEQAWQGGSFVGLQDIEKSPIVASGDLRQLGKNAATPPRQGK